mgnify:CR=1 FL=1
MVVHWSFYIQNELNRKHYKRVKAISAAARSVGEDGAWWTRPEKQTMEISNNWQVFISSKFSKINLINKRR